MKQCTRCLREKPLNQFAKAQWSKDGHRNDCKDCINRSQRRSGWRGPSAALRIPKEYEIHHRDWS